MTTLNITGVVSTQKGIRKVLRDVEKTRPLLNKMGRKLRDDARRRIITQDGGKYAPLSKWTRARTGRRKALTTEKKNISFQIVGSTLIIGHTATGWNLSMHELGFTSTRSVGRVVTIPLRNRKALRDVRDNVLTVTVKNASVIPPRRVFANEVEATTIIRPIIHDWIRKIVAKAGPK